MTRTNIKIKQKKISNDYFFFSWVLRIFFDHFIEKNKYFFQTMVTVDQGLSTESDDLF